MIVSRNSQNRVTCTYDSLSETPSISFAPVFLRICFHPIYSRGLVNLSLSTVSILSAIFLFHQRRRCIQSHRHCWKYQFTRFRNSNPRTIPGNNSIHGRQILSRKSESEIDLLSRLLHGDPGIICTLLGIAPLSLLTGVTIHGYHHELYQPDNRHHHRISWKLTSSGDSAVSNVKARL